MNEERELAKITSADFVLSREFIPDVSIHFKYEGGGQGLTGWFVDIVFLVKLLQVFGAESMDELVGKHAWVTHTRNGIRKLEPAFGNEGKPFDIEKWSEWKKAQPSMSGSDMDALDFS